MRAGLIIYLCDYVYVHAGVCLSVCVCACVMYMQVCGSIHVLSCRGQELAGSGSTCL